VTLRSLKLVPILICVGAITIACLAHLFQGRIPVVGFLERLEWMAYDWRVQTANRFHPPVSDKLGFVYIGDDAIAAFDRGLLSANLKFGLKWPRHIYGRAVRELKAQGAREIGMDIFFNGGRPDHPKTTGLNGFSIGSDEFFAKEIKAAGNVILGATKEVIPEPLFWAAADGLGDLTQERDEDGVLRHRAAFHQYRIWDTEIVNEAILRGWELNNAIVRVDEIVFPAKGSNAVVNINPDGYYDPTELTGIKPFSGIVRLRKAFEDRRAWHLGIVLAARELNLDLDHASVELDKGRITLRATSGIRRVIPVNKRGQFLVDWSVPLNHKGLVTDAFEKIIVHDLERARGTNVEARFAGKLVIIGSTATGNELSDRGATPLEKDTFLTSNYWNVANSVLLDRFIRPSPLPLDLALIVLTGLASALLVWKLRTLWAALLAVVLISLCVGLCVFAFVHYRFLLPMVVPVSSALFTHFGLLTYQTLFEQNERRRIKAIFTKLVSPNVVNELLKAEKLSLIGARGQVTIFFADVRGFTEMTDRSQAQAEQFVRARRLGPTEAKLYFDQRAQELLHTVNVYLGVIADVIKRHEGTLDKYIGDCVMAFWGAPSPNSRHALACVSAAIDAQRAIQKLNEERAAENKIREQENRRRTASGQPPLMPLDLLALGTGINTGLVTAGLMGSHHHIFNYTVFGRDVNLASRLEGYSGRGRIIIGEATWVEISRDDPALAATCIPIELPATALKGFGTAMRVFEVPWRPYALPQPNPSEVLLLAAG